MESQAPHMDRLHEQLLLRAQLTQRDTQYSPLPDSSTPGSENEVKIGVFLGLLHEIHSTLRYAFRVIEMKSPTIWDEGQIVPSSPRLRRVFARLAINLMKPSVLSKFELGYLRPFGEPSTLVTVLLLVYNTYLRYPPSYRPGFTGPTAATAIEAVLGWQNNARSSLPLAEAALLFQSRTNGYINATQAHWWQSRTLNALTVSPGQGQLEWLALVADTLADPNDINSVSDLEWYTVVLSECSGALEGSKSLVINEIVMTDATIERPNELMNLITGPVLFVPSKITDLIYASRLHLSRLREQPDTPRSLQPASAARAMIKHIKAALRCELLTKRKELYGSWIESEWDAPAILFSLEDIRNIIEHLDNAFSGQYISDQLLRALVVAHRGLKGVCAQARSLVRSITKDTFPPNIQSDVKTQFSKEHVEAIAAAVELSVKILLPTHFEGIRGLSFDGLRIVGTDVERVKKPRCIWDMVFNVVIESMYTNLSWMAVSHSWGQSDGSCFVSINGRANVIPWAGIEDLRNIRNAVLQAGYTLAWMDKVCLRQRGIDGFDSALRHIEWVTDIPFLDVAYSQAGKILVYLEGAGRALQHRSTFREGTAWLFRKWTAQETPSHVELALGSGSCCLEGDFFALCEEAIENWHQRNHRKPGDDASCVTCGILRKRVKAIQEFRALSDDTNAADRVQLVWDLMRGRTAGCAADDVFSLLSILGIARRPLYDSRYTRDQATSLVKETMSDEMLTVLEEKEHCTWFDGMFEPRGDHTFASRRVIRQLGPFSPNRVKELEGRNRDSYRLRGVLSPRQQVKVNINGQILDSVGQTTRNKCACIQINQPLTVDSRSIHCNYFEWHGTGACCASFWDVDIAHMDESALATANCLLLSENKLVCVLLNRQEEDQTDIYRIVPSGEMITTNTAPQWVVLPKAVKSQDVMVELPELEVNYEPILV